MLNPVDFSGRPFHFVGIGGIGMSAIAYILAKQGFTVSGSDLSSNRITQKLQDLGIKIFQGHHADNLDLSNAPQVVCSTAINQQNPEFQVALANNLPILHRSDLLAALIEQFQAISVAGTHGKTTTSSLVGFLLLKAGLDPSIIIGGEVSAWEGNARLGNSKYLVAEADESDGTLVKFRSHIGIITNIELDHPDHYQNLDQVVEIFQTFAKRCDVVVGCIDCPTVKANIQSDITYSLSSLSEPTADYTVAEVQYNSADTQALVIERGKTLGRISIGLLGKHNLSNTLAAIAVARYLGVEWQAIAEALPDFVGASRRFEVKGIQNGITFVDDYAHHPSEIMATLASARQQNTSSRVVAIFQPHRYSRTYRFLEEFSHSFTEADMVIVTDIYAASEPNDGKITGSQVAEAIAATHAERNGSQIHYLPTLQDVQSFLVNHLEFGDLAVFLGAGNLNQAIAPTMQELSQNPKSNSPL